MALPEPKAQAAFMALLARIKTGERTPELGTQMAELARQLRADVVIPECTEIPLVLEPDALSTPVIPSTDALVDAAIAFATPGPR